MSLEITTLRQLLAPSPPAYYGTFSSADTSTIGLLKELDVLLTLENHDGYIFQASPPAYENAKRYIEIGSAFFGPLFPHPEFVPDGEGGIDIEWTNGARKMTLSCRGRNAQNDYIYWQENDVYDARDFSLLRLIDRLRWLNHA